MGSKIIQNRLICFRQQIKVLFYFKIVYYLPFFSRIINSILIFYLPGCFSACWQITNGAVAIFGPFYSNLNQAIGLYCSNLGMGVTHFQASDDHQSYQINSDKSFKMHPSHSDLNKIAMQAMKLLSWNKLSIIYDGKIALLSKFHLI